MFHGGACACWGCLSGTAGAAVRIVGGSALGVSPVFLTGRMSACDLCNVHVDSFDLIFSDVYIGCYSDIVCSTDCAIFSLCTVIPFSPTGF